MSLPMGQVVGTIIQAGGTMIGAKASSDASNFNAQINDQNATIATQQGEAAAIQQRRTVDQRIGGIKAAYGASGVRMDTGSPLDVLADSVAQGELDVQNIRYNAALKAKGFSTSADLDRRRAKGAITSGLFTAAGQAILGGTRASSMSKAGTPIPNYADTTYDSWDFR